MPDPDLKVGQLLVVLELIDDKDELFEADLENITGKVYRAQFEYLQALVELEEPLIQNGLVDCQLLYALGALVQEACLLCELKGVPECQLPHVRANLVVFKVLDEIVDIQKVVAIREDELETLYERVFFKYPAQDG